MKDYSYIPLDYTMPLVVIRYLAEREKTKSSGVKKLLLDGGLLEDQNPQLMKFRALCILRYKLTHA